MCLYVCVCVSDCLSVVPHGIAWWNLKKNTSTRYGYVANIQDEIDDEYLLIQQISIHIGPNVFPPLLNIVQK